MSNYTDLIIRCVMAGLEAIAFIYFINVTKTYVRGFTKSDEKNNYPKSVLLNVNSTAAHCTTMN